MATASETTTKSKASNAYRPPGAGRKWTEEMQRELVDAVRKADRRGTSRQRVYEAMAERFTAACPGETFTAHQVSSQFHLAKARLGYDVVKQPQGATRKRVRTVTKPPTRTKGKVALEVKDPLDVAGLLRTVGGIVTEFIQAVNEVLLEAQAEVEAAERERDEAKRALKAVRDALK